MAFSSRFSFWEQKIKDENNPVPKTSETEGAMSRAKSVPALDPGRGLFRAKSPSPEPSQTSRVRSPSPKARSPVQVPERFRSPEPQVSRQGERVRSPDPSFHKTEQNGAVVTGHLNGAMNGKDDMDNSEQNSTRKKVVKVVRRVVRKVLPSDEDELEKIQEVPPKMEATKAATVSRSFSFKHDTVKTEDDISRGLTNLMVRGRSREPRVRVIRKDERPEVKELEANLEKKDDKKVQPEERREDVATKQQEVSAKPSVAQSSVLERVKSPTFNTSENATSTKPAQNRPVSLPTVVGFIPAPKAPVLSPPPPHTKPSTVSIHI